MPRGSKDSYTDKQKRQAEHIAEGYEERGVSKKTAKARAWATVNKETGGGNRSGSGRGVPDTHESSARGGRIAARKRARKAATKRTTTGRTTTKRAAAKRATTRRTVAKRATAKRAGAKRATAKRSTRRRTS
jgi:hypothetical protein